MLNPRRVGVGFLAAALSAASVSACGDTKSKQPPFESTAQAASRLVRHHRGGALAFASAPTSYRVEYDLYVKGHTKGDVGGNGPQPRTLLDATTVVRNVVRPFEESGAVRRTLGFVRDVAGGASRVTFLRPLPDDPRPQSYPPAGKPQFRRTIAGRECASYLIDGGEYCVDRQGIVLLTRSANSLEIVKKVSVGAKTISADALARRLAKGFVNTNRGSIRPIDPDTAPAGATDYSLAAPPDGFALVGRYAVVPLTAEVLKRTSRQVVAGVVDVYVRGADAVVVERGGKLDTSAVGDQDLGSLINARDVDLGVVGPGRVGTGGNGAFGYREVRASPAKGRYVVVAGTLPEDELVALAQSLQAWPGDGMRFLDRPS